jgi:hypothetical protein
MRRRGWARKVERYCCTAVTYFPLVFVYGLTSWAVWVQAGIGFVPSKNVWTGASPFYIYVTIQIYPTSNKTTSHEVGKLDY